MNGRAFVHALLLAAMPLAATAASAEVAGSTKLVIELPRTAVERIVDLSKNPDRETRDTIRRLLFDLNSDVWQDREYATRQLIQFDQAAVQELNTVIEKSADAEVLIRARKALIAIREAPIRGSFTQIDAQVRDTTTGNVRDGDTREGWLVVGDGKATWYQRYGGTVTAQTYGYDISKPLPLTETLDIPLTYESIETEIGYSVENHDPKLTFTRTVNGEVKVTFVGTDGLGQCSTVSFVLEHKK
jgi:hypothetical protein